MVDQLWQNFWSMTEKLVTYTMQHIHTYTCDCVCACVAHSHQVSSCECTTICGVVEMKGLLFTKRDVCRLYCKTDVMSNHTLKITILLSVVTARMNMCSPSHCQSWWHCASARSSSPTSLCVTISSIRASWTHSYPMCSNQSQVRT